jgi:hypothetical protein
MAAYSKPMKKRLHELATLAHERELAQALGGLKKKFDAWQAGTRTGWELSDDIHQFHDGENRGIYKLYFSNEFDRMVGRAIAMRLVTEEEAGDEVRGAVEKFIRLYRDSGCM